MRTQSYGRDFFPGAKVTYKGSHEAGNMVMVAGQTYVVDKVQKHTDGSTRIKVKDNPGYYISTHFEKA
jgi:hypothetical protein